MWDITTRTTSTVGSSQSKEFVALQQKCDHLSEAYEQLKEQHRVESEQQRAAYEELCQMVMNIAQGGTCAPNSFLPSNPRPPPPPPLY